jgi:hypothetical protein
MVPSGRARESFRTGSGFENQWVLLRLAHDTLKEALHVARSQAISSAVIVIVPAAFGTINRL